MSFWNESSASLFPGQMIDFTRTSAHKLDSDDYSLLHLPGAGLVVSHADSSAAGPAPEAGLQGPIDGLIADLHASSDRSIASALARDDVNLASNDPTRVALGVLGKTFAMVEEGGRDALLGLVETTLHPLDAVGHVVDLLASPKDAVASWWQGTDPAHKYQDLLGVGLLAGLARVMAPERSVPVAGRAPQAHNMDGAVAAGDSTELAVGTTGRNALSDFLGSGLHVPESTRLDRDFSHHMPVSADGTIDYWGPKALGVNDHFLHSSLDQVSGELRFSLQRSAEPVAADRLGYGSEMFASMLRSYRNEGADVRAIVGTWSRIDGLNSNIDRFLMGIDEGLSPERAALATFTGRQAQSFGYTKATVPADERMWRNLGVQPRFEKPDWGADASWNDYANAWVSSMARR